MDVNELHQYVSQLREYIVTLERRIATLEKQVNPPKLSTLVMDDAHLLGMESTNCLTTCMKRVGKSGLGKSEAGQ